jgi:hypothetical protein
VRSAHFFTLGGFTYFGFLTNFSELPLRVSTVGFRVLVLLFSDVCKFQVVFSLFNCFVAVPDAQRCQHNETASKGEHNTEYSNDYLVSLT